MVAREGEWVHEQEQRVIYGKFTEKNIYCPIDSFIIIDIDGYRMWKRFFIGS
jgi:hypothetical protein